MQSIVFVVLHYETLDDTRQCIDSLLKYLIEPEVKIVVVDNGSTKGKISEIYDEYANKEKIYFLRSEENLGFAKGNNIGYRFAKEDLNADIIILANNDLVFEQSDFIYELKKVYNDTFFDVAGPNIISLVDGKNQNPVNVMYNGLSDVKKRIFKDSVLLFLSYLNLDKVFQKLLAKEIPEVTYKKGMNFQLHGACMIFANRYLKNYDGLCEKTFMYGEENILKYIVMRDNMNMAFHDNLTVYHKEGSSTGAVFGKKRGKRKFYYKWNLHSCKQLRKMLEQDTNKK